MFLNKSNLSLFCLKWKHMKAKVLLAVTNKCNNTCTWDWWVWSEKSKLLENKIRYLYSTYSLRCNIRFRRCYLIWGHLHWQINTFNFREAINIKKVTKLRTFSVPPPPGIYGHLWGSFSRDIWRKKARMSPKFHLKKNYKSDETCELRLSSGTFCMSFCSQ